MKISNTIRPLPRQFEIAGIRTALVDPHKDVLPYWFSAYRGAPFVVVRADSHQDMLCKVRIPDEAINLGPSCTMPEYLKTKTNIQNFTIPAFHHGVVAALYMIEQDAEDIIYFGKVKNGLIAETQGTTVKNGYLTWAEGCGGTRAFDQTLTFSAAFLSLKGSPFPLITDIDLDVIACTHEDNYFAHLKGKTDPPFEKRIGPRINRLGYLLSNFPRPELITIARSQEPVTCTPPEYVDQIQDGVIDMLEKCYGQ